MTWPLAPELGQVLLLAFIVACTIAALCCLALGVVDVLRDRRERQLEALEAERLRILRDTLVLKGRLDEAAFRASQAMRRVAEEHARNARDRGGLPS